MATLSWAAAAQAQAPVTANPQARFLPRWVNYYGPPGFIQGVSYVKALDPALVKDDFFRDKVVFVGARLLTKFAGDRKDEFRTPYSFWMQQRGQMQFVAGVEIQATLFLNLTRADWLRRLSAGAELAWLLVLGAAFGAGLILLRPLAASTAAFLGIAVVLLAAFALFQQRLTWFPWLILVAQVLIALFWSIVFNSVQLYVQKRLSEQTLSLYLSPKLVRKFLRNPAWLRQGAEEQAITIFFSDIEDFTAISQELTSQELATLMNEYFEEAVTECVKRTDGTVVKYIGDAIFAFWNAPELQADHAARACEAALRLRDLPPRQVRARTLHTRMGIHTGIARVGNFGSLERVDYTALGESVNLASRLEGLNKFLGTQCLISQATRDLVGGRVVTRGLGRFQLKGFDKPVEVFELVGWPADQDSTGPWRQAFEAGLKHLELRQLDPAEACFRDVLSQRPEDRPAGFYLRRIADLRRLPPEQWSAHTVVQEK